MRKRSDIWVKLAQRDYAMETKAVIGDKTYKAISAPKINRSLMSKPLSVGNCISATLGLSILTDDVLDAKVPIVIKGRLTDGQSVSEWLPFGTFYINQKSSYKGLWTVSCYDAMLKANQSYLSADSDGTGWPKAMSDVVAEIAYRIGVSVDSRTVINTGEDYTVPCPTGLTMMQVLGYIGGCHGGNWIITEDNALRLVPLMDSPTGASTAPIVIKKQPESVTTKLGASVLVFVEAIGEGLTYAWYSKKAGAEDFVLTHSKSLRPDAYIVTMTEAHAGMKLYCVITDAHGNSIKTRVVVINTPDTENDTVLDTEIVTVVPDSAIEDTHYITGDDGLPIVTPEGFYLVWAEDGYVSAVDGLATVNAVLGSLDIGTSVTVTGVSMSSGSNEVFTAGGTAGVGIIKIESNPYATQGICDTLYSKYGGYVYAPYTATKAIYDPAAELGDQVVIGDMVHSVLYAATLNMDIRFVSNISAPNSEELTEEYPYLTEYKKLAQTTAALNASIKETAEDLTEKVEGNNTDVSALAGALADEITRASGVERELNTRIGAEENRAKGAEKILDDKIVEEENRAKQAEAALQLAINLLTSGNIADMSSAIAALQEQDVGHDTAIAGLQQTVADQAAVIADLSARLAALEGNTDPDPEPGTDPGTE